MASKVRVRTYSTPVAFRAAIESRLRHGTSGAGFQRRRQLLVFGRFIARLIALFGDRIVIKGPLANDNDLRWRTLADVYAAAKAFIEPVLANDGEATWIAAAWRWQR